MNKELQYTYDEISFRQKIELLYEKVTRTNSDAGSYVLLILMFLLSGGAFLYFNADGSGIVVGPMLLLMGLAFLIRLLVYFYKRKQYTTAFKKGTDDAVKRLNKTDGILRITISDDYFFYGDDDAEVKLKWEFIQSYLRIDDHLFLLMDNEALSCYAISAADIGYSDFEEVREFIQQKLEMHHLGNSSSEKKEMNAEILDN